MGRAKIEMLIPSENYDLLNEHVDKSEILGTTRKSAIEKSIKSHSLKQDLQILNYKQT